MSATLLPMFPEPITSEPNPAEINIIIRAQSILTMNGEVGPVLPYEQALDVVKWEEHNTKE